MGDIYSTTRQRGTNKRGNGFSAAEVEAVWKKGSIDPSLDAFGLNKRRDTCGREIHKGAHGDTNSRYGWEIDHIIPIAKGGSDEISNLQPLYWETNRDKAYKYPWRCGM